MNLYRTARRAALAKARRERTEYSRLGLLEVRLRCFSAPTRRNLLLW